MPKTLASTISTWTCSCSCTRAKKKTAYLRDGMLFGIGTPLMDMLAVVDSQFLKKYGLQPNNTILGTDDLLPMLFELEKNYNVEYFPGGSEQNTFRVVQWILQKPKVSTLMGATGSGKNGKILEKIMKKDGVDIRYQKLVEYHTGICVVLITGQERSLCAYLNASNYFNPTYLARPKNFALVEKAKFFYVTGYFLTVSPESIMMLAEHATKTRKPFALNLSATYICRGYLEPLLSVMPHVDILFGNKAEMEAFAEAYSAEGVKYKPQDVAQLAKGIAACQKINTDMSRLVVLTQGAGSVVVAWQNRESVVEYPVTPIPHKNIKDTNGAGDAFVGGFLAQYIQDQGIDECVKCGIWAASEVIQQTGCTFPKNKSYDDDDD